jgi:Ca2+-transporting ATPase
VFLEFLIDPACSIAFEAEPSDEEAMNRPPRDPLARLFDGRTLAIALGTGAGMLAALLLACGWAIAGGRGDEEVRTLGFAAIVFGNLALILASRSSERTIFATLARPNPALWWVIGGAGCALGIAVYVPAVAEIFRFAPLGALDLAVALGAGILGVLGLEAIKLAQRRTRMSR